MPILSRTLTLALALMISGCSAVSLKTSDAPGDCQANRNSCLYEGAYEPGERAYAQQEASRLNQAELARLRRGTR